MPRKSIKKPPSKSPRTSRRRCEANQPSTTSSSSDPSLASVAAEREAARQERSRSKSRARSKAKAEAAAQSQPLPQTTGISGEQAGISFTRPDSPRTPPRLISPRRKTRTSRSPFNTKSPLATGATTSTTPPPKKRVSKTLRGPSSNLLAEGRPGSFVGTFNKNVPIEKTLETIKYYASIGIQPGPASRTSVPSSRERKAYVFVPNTDRINHRSLGLAMSQLYGYLGTVQEDGPQYRRLPSADEQSPLEESKNISVLDVRRQPIREEVRAERDAEREAEREAAAREIAEQETETLVRVLSNLSAPSSSPEPKRKSPSPNEPKSVFQYMPDLIERRHSADAGVVPPSRGGSSHVAPEFGKGKSRVKFTLRRIPDKSQAQLHKVEDSERSSSSGIQMIELGPIRDSSLARRRLSRNEDPAAEEEKAAASQAEEESRGEKVMGPPPKAVGLSHDSQKPGPSSYRETRASVESDESHDKYTEDGDPLELGDSGDTPPPSYSYVSQELSESVHVSLQSEVESSVTSTGNWSGSISRPPSDPRSTHRSIPTPDVLTCDWRQCYREFILAFNRRSATVTEFFAHLESTLIRRIREPGTDTRRYFLVAGLSIWMLIQDVSNDYWFFCGGRDEETVSGQPPRMMDPDSSLDFLLGAEPAPPPERSTVRNICSEAARRVASGARTIRRRRASSREPQRTPEELEANIQRLLTLIRAKSPIGPVEPRRDFTAADCPFISLSFQDDIPENPATFQATGEAEGDEAEGEEAESDEAECDEAEGDEAECDEAEGDEAADEATGAVEGEPEASGSKLNVPAEKKSDEESRPDEDPEAAV